jgi:hypothetical protein
MDFIQKLESWKATNTLESFWVGHSVFQVPVRVLNYKGTSEALVLAYLFDRANSNSFYSNGETAIEIREQETTIAKRTGLDRCTVSQAVISLEADGCISVERRRDPVTKQIRLSIYLLLHSQTKNPLVATPGVFGVCHQNNERPYITTPRESRQKLTGMNPAARQVYLTALALASERACTSFGVVRGQWKSKTRLGRNSFDRGVQECTKAGLLTYQRYVLTINDPRTGEPSERAAGERTEHESPKWKFDLNTVTEAQWKTVIGKLLPGREFFADANGWSYTGRSGICPFCKTRRSFTLNFKLSRYKCFNEACGENRSGRLGQLVQRKLRVNKMATAKSYIKDCTEAQEQTAKENVA